MLDFKSALALPKVFLGPANRAGHKLQAGRQAGTLDEQAGQELRAGGRAGGGGACKGMRQ